MTPTSRDVAVAVMEETSRGSRAAIETFLRGSPIEAKGSAQFATLPLPRYAAFSLSTSRERFASQNSEKENHMQKRIASALAGACVPTGRKGERCRRFSD